MLNTTPTISSKQADRGFALILALSLMSFIFLMLLTLSTLSGVELSTSVRQKQKLAAEQNALLGFQIALGNLQKQLGVDQRISASPLMLDKTLNSNSPVSHWTGTWDTAANLPDGTPNSNFGEHIGWLISGYDQPNPSSSILSTIGSGFKGDGSLVDSDVDAMLLGGGSVDADATNTYVAAPKVNINDSSQYAYWVADEGRKARVNLASRDEQNDVGYPGASSNVKTRFALSSPSRVNPSILSGLETFLLEDNEVLADAVARSGSSRDLLFSDPGYTGVDSPWADAIGDHYHDIAYSSITLQTDARNGGLKKDLSLLFELDDNDFAMTPYSGVTNESAFGDWTLTPPTDAGDYIDPATGDQVSFLFKEPIESSRYAGREAFVRGPTWHYLRDFYRLYKDIDGNQSLPRITTRPFAPNTSDFSGRGGLQGLIATLESDAGGDISSLTPQTDNYVNTVTRNAATGSNEQVTRLTGHEVAPLVNRVIYTYSLYNDIGVSEYEYDEVSADSGGPMFRTTGGTTDAISLVIEPFVYLWNPYNVAIEFDGGFKIHASESAFGLMISVAPSTPSTTVDIFPPIDDLSIPQMTGYFEGYAFLSNNGNSSNLDLIIGGGNNTIRMEPGEVLVFSDASIGPQLISDLPLSNNEDWQFRARALHLSEGFSISGGVLIGRRERTNESVDNHGIFHQLKTAGTSAVEVNVYNWGFDGFYKRGRGGNSKDRRQATSRIFSLEYGYMPEEALTSGGSLFTTDTLIQRLHLTLNGPQLSDGKNGPLEGLLYGGGNAEFPALISKELIRETGKVPFLYYGVYQNPVTPDAQRVATTSEFIGTMSPFAPLLDPQFSNFTMQSPPYSVQIGYMSDYDEIQHDGNGRGYFGAEYGAGGETNLVVSEIPTYPLRSLGSLQHARISHSTYMPGQAIGNSWASGFFDLDETYVDEGRYSIYDISYLSNEALFDSCFFSSLTPTMDLSNDITELDDLEGTLRRFLDAYTTTGKLPELSNDRFVYLGSLSDLNAGSSGNSDFVSNLSAVDGFAKTAAYFGVKGGFNINSLSVDAWDMFLASSMGLDFSYLNPSGGYSLEDNDEFTILPRTTLPNGASDDIWLGPKGLDETERRALAQEIVNQVQERGPFLSLADFVNRSLADDANIGRSGTLQSAIDSDTLSINDDNEYLNAYEFGTSGKFDPANVTAKSGVGTPQYLTQADLITPMAPYLSVRSDTFTIRSYGEVDNPFTGEVDSRVWCEAVVQRMPEFIDSTDGPATQVSNLIVSENQIFGRRFRVVSFRWLSEDEV